MVLFLGVQENQKNLMEGMIMYEKEIELKIRELPEDLKREVLDYIEFLLQKYGTKKTRPKGFKFDWEGSLSELRDKFTSVELQHNKKI
jgi:hypothetical protein